MTSERMMILEMVKDGKISVDEGVKLLNAINKNNSSSINEFTNDLKYKINNFAKPDAKKIKQNTQSFINKTEEIIDDFAKSVKDLFSPSDDNNNQNYDNDNKNNTQETNNNE